VYGEKKRNFVGQHFWARGYFVSTVGRDEAVIREYIKNQEQRGTTAWTKLNFVAADRPPSGGQRMQGRVSDPDRRFERPYS